MPQGYNGVEILIQQSATIGVNVIRNDNAVVWRYVPTTSFQGAIAITGVIAFEVNQMFGFYGFNGNFEILCTETKSVNQGGIFTTFSARLIRFGNNTGLVWANTHFVQSLGNTFVTSSVSSGPTNEYENLVMKIFLPLVFQLLVNDNGVLDSDSDGTPDSQDNFKFDPTRQ